MTGKEANVFFKDKFKQSLKKDLVFWIATLAGIAVAILYFIFLGDWYDNFLDFVRFNWTRLGLWIGVSLLLTRNYNDTEDIKSHHQKSIYRILLLGLAFVMPFAAFFALPAAVVWWIIQKNKNQDSTEELPLEELDKSKSKIAIISIICSSLAVPLLAGITILQDMMISSGLIHRRDTLASPGIGFLIGIILAISGIVLWAISRKNEGRHVWNFWAMRIVIVNVILAPFVLIFMLAVTISRSK